MLPELVGFIVLAVLGGWGTAPNLGPAVLRQRSFERVPSKCGQALCLAGLAN